MERVRAAGDPLESPALNELYALALRDGVRALGRFGLLNEQEREDVVAEKIARELTKIVEADNPRGFLVVMVVRAAKSAIRRKATTEKYETDVAFIAQGNARTEDDTLTTLSLAGLLLQLSSSHQQIVHAVHSGENREDVARRFGTTRNNVDKIVSRVAKLGTKR